MEALFNEGEIKRMLRGKNIAPEIISMAIELYCNWDGCLDQVRKKEFFDGLIGEDSQKAIEVLDAFNLIVSMIHNERMIFVIRSCYPSKGGACA